jgi:hypothetical protein
VEAPVLDFGRDEVDAAEAMECTLTDSGVAECFGSSWIMQLGVCVRVVRPNELV